MPRKKKEEKEAPKKAEKKVKVPKTLNSDLLEFGSDPE